MYFRRAYGTLQNNVYSHGSERLRPVEQKGKLKILLNNIPLNTSELVRLK